MSEPFWMDARLDPAVEPPERPPATARDCDAWYEHPDSELGFCREYCEWIPGCCEYCNDCTDFAPNRC